MGVVHVLLRTSAHVHRGPSSGGRSGWEGVVGANEPGVIFPVCRIG